MVDEKTPETVEVPWEVRQDPVTKEDERHYVTRAEFKRWRVRTMMDLNAILQGWQAQSLVPMQGRLALIWNSVNAIVRVFVWRKLFTPEELERAGRQLMKEAKRNIDETKAAAARKARPIGLTKTPLETCAEVIYKEDDGGKSGQVGEVEGGHVGVEVASLAQLPETD